MDGTRESQTLGATVLGAGDLDGDGVPEIAAGGPRDDLATGTVLIFSGATGAKFLELHPVEIRGNFGGSLAASGDLDGDGVPELIVGAPFTTTEIGFGVGSVLVFSGANGGLLYNFEGEEPGTYMGWAVGGIGDIDADGVPDLLIGTPYGSRGDVIGVGNVFIRSGRTGELIARFDGEEAGDYLGWSFAGIGDINGDSVPDLLLGAPNSSPGGRAQAGRVEVRSGATGNLIYRLEGLDASAYFGRSIAVVGDVDGDNIPDFAVGAPEASPNGLTSAGSVFVYSGATGRVVYQLDGRARFDNFGASIGGRLDVDGDGVADIVVGAPDASPNGLIGAGSAFVFSGATGQLLFRWDGAERGDSLGYAVNLIGDLNGDGRAEVLIGAPYANPQGHGGAGSVFVLSY